MFQTNIVPTFLKNIAVQFNLVTKAEKEVRAFARAEKKAAKLKPSKTRKIVKRKINSRQLKFASLIAKGKSKSEAYKIAYDKADASPGRLATLATDAAKRGPVAEFLAEKFEEANEKVDFTVTKRLEILAEIAQRRSFDPRVNLVAIKAIEVYSKLAGDAAPDRSEIKTTLIENGDGLKKVNIVNLPVRDRIAALARAQDERKGTVEAEPVKEVVQATIEIVYEKDS